MLRISKFKSITEPVAATRWSWPYPWAWHPLLALCNTSIPGPRAAKPSVIRLLAVLALCGLLPGWAAAQSLTQMVKLLENDRQGPSGTARAVNDYFGYSVAISGDYAIVGAHLEDEDAAGGAMLSSAGSAYVFVRSGTSWTFQQKLVAADRAGSDFFGYSVAISGDYAIVGAHQEDQNATGGATLSSAGSAYVFVRSGTTWTQQQKLVADDRAVTDNFGASVAISGDYALVGANLEDEDAAGGATIAGAGSAYVFGPPPAPMPVELTAFTATREGNGAVRLAWATATEQNSATFEVERSADGRGFSRIATVAAAGHSSAARRYDFQDAQLPAGAGPLYYRLRQVDADGTFAYSPVRTVAGRSAAVSAAARLVLAPNPASARRSTLHGAAASAPVQVFDVLGRPVLTATAAADGTAPLALPAALPAGVYLVRAGTQALRLVVE